jgi:hypothetical protein
MAKPQNLSAMFSLPHHLIALQILVDRCPDAISRKELIVTAGMCCAINDDEGFVMVTANQLETA